MPTKTHYYDRYIQIVIITALAYFSFELIKPFLSLLLWGLILAVATYPAYDGLNRRLGRRPILAASLLTIVSLILIIIVLYFLTNNMVGSLTDLIHHLRESDYIIPLPPASVETWPLIGVEVSDLWQAAATNFSEVIKEYSGYITNAVTFLLTSFASKSFAFIVFILSVIFSGYLLAKEKVLVRAAYAFVERAAPGRTQAVITIIKETIRNVSIGVIGIAVVQALFFGFSLLVAGVPAAALLTFLALLLSIAQLGIILLVVPVVIWIFFTYSTVAAIAYTTLLVVATFVDNVLRPFVLSHGLNTPIVVILLGVLGGLLWDGLIGIFVGPVILAITYDLVRHWLNLD